MQPLRLLEKLLGGGRLSEKPFHVEDKLLSLSRYKTDKNSTVPRTRKGPSSSDKRMEEQSHRSLPNFRVFSI